jgi:hypothetical protein
LLEILVRSLDFAADIRQATVLFMPQRVVRIDRHNHAAQAALRQLPHLFLRPERAVRANHRVQSRFCREPHHRSNLRMNQRLTAHKEQVTNVIFDCDANDILGLLE